MAMRSISLTLIVCLLVCGALASGGSAAQISGQVLDAAGKPVAGATVQYHNVRQFAAGPAGKPIPASPLISESVATNPEGAFTLSDLSPDTYYLCAYGTNPAQLPACAWNGGETRVAANSGQNVPNVTLQFVSGTVVNIQVADPSHRIIDISEMASRPGLIPINGGNFSVGAFSGHAYQKAALISTTSSGRLYQLTVPAVAPFSLYIATNLNVTDANGQPVSVGKPGDPISSNSTTSAGGMEPITVILNIN